MLRITLSGCGGASTLSPKVSVQLAPLSRSSELSDCICGRLRRMRIACPFSSGSRLTSPISAPALTRIRSTSSDLVESNTNQTASPRRNEAAGVGVPKENFSRKPSLSRMTSTRAASSLALSLALACGGESDATVVAFGAAASVLGVSFFGASGLVASGLDASGLGDSDLAASDLAASDLADSGLGASAMAAGICFGGVSDDFTASAAAGLAAGSGAISGAGGMFAVSGLISIFASRATLSDVGGMIC